MAGACWGVAAPVSAQERQGPEWRDEWRRFETWEYVTLPLLYAPVALRFLIPPDGAQWYGGSVDRSLGDFVALEDRTARRVALRTGDTMFGALLVVPLIDVAVARWGHGRDELSEQLLLVNLQAMGSITAMFFLTQWLFRRDRPYRDRCAQDSTYDLDCHGQARWESFPSGHFAVALGSALLTCVNHAHVPLYGEPWDGVACGAALGLAGWVGLSRLLAHVHWPSDVLIGALMGVAGGFLVPTALHYGFGGS